MQVKNTHSRKPKTQSAIAMSHFSYLSSEGLSFTISCYKSKKDVLSKTSQLFLALGIALLFQYIFQLILRISLSRSYEDISDRLALSQVNRVSEKGLPNNKYELPNTDIGPKTLLHLSSIVKY